MSSFHNKDVVHNQVGGTQNNYGDMYFGTVHKGSEMVDYSQTISPDGLTKLDNEVLASLAFPRMLERRNNIESAHPATCQWILSLDEFKTWESHPRGFLWIKGKPGAGKSTAMAFLYDTLKKNRQPQGLLQSLLSQLFLQAPCVRSQIRNIYEEKQSAFGHGQHSWEWQQRELERILPAAIVTAAIGHPITIFVDALDEAGETSAREIAKYIHSIYDRVTEALVSVKLCISCRHYPIVGPSRYTEIHVEKHNLADIATYIHDCLDLSCIENDEERAVWTEMKTDLLKRANGVFQWVNLLVQLVNKKIADGESPADVRKALQQVPEELNDVYQFILCCVVHKEHRRASLCLFRWVCFAQRPLSLTEIRYAMACLDIEIDGSRCHETPNFITTDDRMKLRLKALSGGLVEAIHDVSGGHQIKFYSRHATMESVQVVHQSVTDFLYTRGLWILENAEGQTSMSPLISGLRSKHQSESIRQGHNMLYKSCLLYLSTELEQGIRSSHLSRSYIITAPRDYRDGSVHEILMAVRDLILKAPLIPYCVLNLFVHFGEAERIYDEDVRTHIRLLQQIMLDWITAYNLFDQLSKECPREGTTLLHVVSTLGLIDIVRYLIHNSTHVRTEDVAGNTALHMAAERGHYDVVKVLVEAGAEVHKQNYKHETPLVLAAGAGHVVIVQQLLCQGGGLTGRDGVSEMALCAAAFGQHVETIKILLAAGADVNAPGGDHGNALQAAAASQGVRRLEVVRMLLAAGADVNAPYGQHGTALQLAMLHRREVDMEVVQTLLDAGANVNARGWQYGTALQISVMLKPNLEIVRMLLDAGADVNAPGGEYGSALIAAARTSSTEVVRMFLAAGADVNARSEGYGTALQAIVASYANTEVIRMLLDAGAYVNALGGAYGYALIAAAYNSNVKAVQMLLAAGADVNVQYEHYGSALQVARRADNWEIEARLLEAGASEETW